MSLFIECCYASGFDILTKLWPGYIGGDAFYALEKKHPDYEYTLLVRNEDRGKEVKAKYPNAKLVYGSLEDSAVIEKAASEADIVVRQ